PTRRSSDLALLVVEDHQVVVDAQAQVAVIGGLRDRLSGGFAVPAGPDVALGAVPGAVGAALGLGRGRRCAGASGGMLACLSTVERDHEQRCSRGPSRAETPCSVSW